MAVADMPAAAAPPPGAKRFFTFEEYLAGPRLQGSYDIIDGELIEMPGASLPHQMIVVRLVALFFAFQQAARLGQTLTAPCDVLIRRRPFRSRQPDVSFITNDLLAEAGGVPVEGPLTVGPELVVEILSPSKTPRTVRAKLEDLASVGAREAWLVSPEAETVQVLRLSPQSIEAVDAYVYGQTLESEAIPGLSVALADLFSE